VPLYQIILTLAGQSSCNSGNPVTPFGHYAGSLSPYQCSLNLPNREMLWRCCHNPAHDIHRLQSGHVLLHMQGRGFICTGECLFDAIVQPLLIALDRNQVVRPFIYDHLGYFMLPAHSVNGDKATFYFQKIKSIGNGCDFIRLRVCLRLPDNHAISRGKGTDDWRSCRLYELRKRLPSTVTTSLSPSFTASCIQRIKVDCNALESILEIRWAIVL
jgi:hypothetical protein